jgi:pyruvate/2-oxoglutarate dehydrogenase complex dihydrolipoamide dehydrogenase (E3) component
MSDPRTSWWWSAPTRRLRGRDSRRALTRPRWSKGRLGGTCLNWGCIPTKPDRLRAPLRADPAGQANSASEVGQPTITGAGCSMQAQGRSQLTGGVNPAQGRQVDIPPAPPSCPPPTGCARRAGWHREISAENIILPPECASGRPASPEGERDTSQEAPSCQAAPASAVLGGGVVGRVRQPLRSARR